MDFNEKTKLLDILKAYPDLEDKVAALDPRLSAVKGPLGKMLLRGKTVKDASDCAGIPVPELLRQLEEMIKTLYKTASRIRNGSGTFFYGVFGIMTGPGAPSALRARMLSTSE